MSVLDQNFVKGIGFALVAAALNGSIGIFSKILIKNGLSIEDIAFLKTFAAFLILSLFLFKMNLQRQKSLVLSDAKISNTKLFFRIGLCAFLGVFVLFFFETNAYKFGYASNVVVILMASAAISALVFGKILLNEDLKFSAIIGTFLAVMGIFIISWSKGANFLLIINATIAGSGYGIFSVLIQRFGFKGGLVLTRALMFFASIYLFLPFLAQLHKIDTSLIIILNLLALALLPTIVGFYCTTKALLYLSAAKVQVTELSEPIFAAFLAWILFYEIPSSHFFIGAVFIVLGIIFINQIFTRIKK